MGNPFDDLSNLKESSGLGGFLQETWGNYTGMNQQNAANVAAASKQMRFQEAMSSSAHQREVKDLRAAGLNPMMSAMGGGGASSPQGASSQAGSVSMEGLVSSAIALKQMKADVAKAESETQLNKDAQQKTKQDTKIGQQTEKLVQAQIQGAKGTSKSNAAIGEAASALNPFIQNVKNIAEKLTNSGKNSGYQGYKINPITKNPNKEKKHNAKDY